MTAQGDCDIADIQTDHIVVAHLGEPLDDDYILSTDLVRADMPADAMAIATATATYDPAFPPELPDTESWVQRLDDGDVGEFDPFDLHIAGAQRAHAVVGPGGQGQFEIGHGKDAPVEF